MIFQIQITGSHLSDGNYLPWASSSKIWSELSICLPIQLSVTFSYNFNITDLKSSIFHQMVVKGFQFSAM